MKDNKISKADLWADRINAFQQSGLSHKEWCQQAGIPQSTFGYWIRKIQSEISGSKNVSGPVFAKLPSEQEILSGEGAGTHLITICLPDNIRIEGKRYIK